MPEKLSDEERKEMEAVSDDGLDTDDYDSEDSEEDETLNGFIVPDELSDSDGFEPAQDVRPKIKKSKRKGKGKEKAPKKTLAQLKKESLRNRAAKIHYLRRLQRNWQTSAKIEKTMQILHEIQENDPTEKTIIFSQFTSLLDLLEVPLSNEKWSYERYDGSMKANDRADAVSDFMEKAERKVMLISLKAGNAGLNLNKASQVIILDPFWNPFVEDQAIDRAHRIMQQRRVHVHRILIENTVEDRIIALQEKKRELISTALDENAGRSISRLGERELAYLFVSYSNCLRQCIPSDKLNTGRQEQLLIARYQDAWVFWRLSYLCEISLFSSAEPENSSPRVDASVIFQDVRSYRGIFTASFVRV
jgi:SNF2 family DNA or RNA helicase